MLTPSHVQSLHAWVQDGGTVVLFASQLAGAAINSPDFVGATLKTTAVSPLPNVVNITDLETGWVKNTSSKPFASPFCAPQSNGTDAAWYIKTGGDPTVKVGWGLGSKCCLVTPTSCQWFTTKGLCEASISTAVCLRCPCDGSGPRYTCCLTV